MEDLIKKYNVPAPRYTSYPTVPFWDKEAPTDKLWFQVVKKTFEESNNEKGISIYIHLPFCESLCTYCGCNKRITKNHLVEDPYIEAILKEWQMYLKEFKRKPVIRELHLGGGTPTFFSPENLEKLLYGIYKGAIIHPENEYSFEGHPNNTSWNHMKVLYDLGFKRVSFGIQDFDPVVQKTINRIQPFENVERVTLAARKIGYQSVNFDLIYGLPFQTLKSIENTIDRVGELMPDRIAFYSYAHVPWVSPSQRSYTEADLPGDSEKRALYELGKKKLKNLGYIDIGMDHFSLPSDNLYLALQEKKLHRNFMGYTTCNTDLMIGLGTSSISDAKYAYLQNEKTVEGYKTRILNDSLPVLKGHLMTHEDLIIKKAILDIACKGYLEWKKDILGHIDEEARGELLQMQEEGLIIMDHHRLEVTQKGFAFIRNICMVFDNKYRSSTGSTNQIFSKAI
jgi:oxygen-independent coproporphyrinogen III oxidase